MIDSSYILGDNVIIATSDVHLGYFSSDENLFRKFLDDVVDKEEVKHLVLAGDILDMWRRENLKLFIEFRDILDKLEYLQNNKKQVYYVVGNHDYHMIQLKHNFEKHYTFDISMEIPLECGEEEYYFIHGYQFEFPDILDTYEDFASMLCLSDDTIGKDADQLWGLYTAVTSPWKDVKMEMKKDLKKALGPAGERLSDEDIGKLKKNIKKWRKENKDQIDDKFIIYGHTHRPYVDEKNKEANAGSWVDDPVHYLTIEEDGTITLNEYP